MQVVRDSIKHVFSRSHGLALGLEFIGLFADLVELAEVAVHASVKSSMCIGVL